MELLNLLVRVTAKNEASDTIEDVSSSLIGRLAGAAKTAAKALATLFAVKKVVDFGRQAFAAYSQFEQLQGGVAKLYGNAGMSIEEYAQSVGKSVSQVTSDYQRNAEAQAIVMKNAQQAWKTAGMDANSYMQTATSFSASLINSLGGDTREAARLTDEAMKAMSDNVNTFGSDMGSVQNAFQGFAKQNYMMLDNLKLGYGGTKSEMERLISDASKMTKEQEQLNMKVDAGSMSFDNIVRAIQVVQKHQGIYGTTAKEAMNTIEGSMNATKAAWQNLVAEFGKPDADIGARISDMFTALMGENGEGGLVRNVTKEVRIIASNMIRAVSEGMSSAVSYIGENGPKLVADAMQKVAGSIGNASKWLSGARGSVNLVDLVFGKGDDGGLVGKIGGFFSKMSSTIQQNWPQISSALGTLWDEVVATAQTYGPQIMEVAGRLLQMAGNAIAEHGPEIAAKVSQLFQDGLNAVGKLVGMAAAKGVEFVGGLLTGSSKEGKALHEWFASFFPDGLLRGLGDFGKFLLDAGRALINGLLDGIGEVAPDVEEAIRGAFQTVLDFFNGVGEFMKDPIGSIQRGLGDLVGAYNATSANVDGNMSHIEGSVDRAMTNAGASLGKYNGTKLKDKKSTAKVTGNAQDGKAKDSVDKTKKAIDSLSGKSVSVSASGNIVSGVAKAAIDNVRNAISLLKSKNVTVTTTKVTKTYNSGAKREEVATGGIRRHARGDIMVANNPVQGVPLDIVGEAGPEAIVPLTSRYGKTFAKMMGQEASRYMGGNVYILQIGDIQYNTDKAMDEAIDRWFAVAARRAGQYGIG